MKTIFGFVPPLCSLKSCSLMLTWIDRSRSARRTREAAQQFTLVARGLEGSSFGYASVTM